jgi:uncharacterized membrane protein YdbT with pleckstrin-like domain
MSYVDTILEPGEHLRYRTRISWTIYSLAIALALSGLIIWWITFKFYDIGHFGGAIAALLLLGALASFVPAWLRRAGTEIAVTDRRVILKRGLIRRHTVEMNMTKVESVDVDQTVAGRIFNYGDVTIRGTGTTFERLRFVDAPLKLRSTLTAG